MIAWARARRWSSPPDRVPIGVVGVVLGADRGHRLGDTPVEFGVAARESRPPPPADQAELDELGAGQAELGVERAPLGDVTDGRVAPPRRPSEDRYRAGRRPQQAEQQSEQGGLARSVRPEDGDELARRHREVGVRPHGPGAVGHTEADGIDHCGRRSRHPGLPDLTVTGDLPPRELPGGPSSSSRRCRRGRRRVGAGIEGVFEIEELGAHPILERTPGRLDGLGHPDDRDTVTGRQLPHVRRDLG